LYSTRSNLILGFHGCEQEDQNLLIKNPGYFKVSQQSYDWIGHGMYFWENNEKRALTYSNMCSQSKLYKRNISSQEKRNGLRSGLNPE